MSLSKGATYHMIKPSAPLSYNRYSKQPPSISRQMAVCHMAFSWTYLNLLALTTLTATWRLTMRSSLVLGGLCKCAHLGVPTGRNQLELDPMTWGGHLCPVNLPGYAVFNHCHRQVQVLYIGAGDSLISLNIFMSRHPNNCTLLHSASFIRDWWYCIVKYKKFT